MTFVDSCALLSFRLFYTSRFSIKRKFLSKPGTFHMDIRHETRSTMEVVNVPPIITIYRQALRTFDDKHKTEMPNNLTKLKAMMDSLKSEDLGFDKTLNDPEIWRKQAKAPCTYIEVFQNSQLNMSIFVLKPGFKMPLHDHPHMHGLLKVISGAVNIKAFSEFPLKEAVKVVDFQTRARHEAARIASGVHKKRRLFAEITSDRVCNEESGTCILTPTISNYHEIEALQVPAAFFDILSPPYDTLIENIGPRRCRYYHVANKISNNLVELQETEVPKCFYCDQAPYLGPTLS